MEEPEYSDECWRTTKACAYEEDTILIGVNSGLPEQAPQVVELLKQWDFNADVHLRNVVRWQEANPDASIEDASFYWLSNNVDTWSGWVTDEAATDILAALDKDALVALYNATGGANWTNNTNWLTNAPIGQWYGVTTDGRGRVTELNLTSNQLKGEIPPELANLTNLSSLTLGGNELTGPIPTWLGGLTNLEELYLWDNQLSGTIPAELGNLTNLKSLRLWGNQLSGRVPQTLVGLTMLESFIFHHNAGLCAPIDDAFQTWLRGISIVSGSSCAPADSPEDRAVLVQVHSATDGANWKDNTNWLSEHLTREWYGVTNDTNGRVHGLFLRSNQLTGKIPSELGSLTKLEWLYLSVNQLTGEIPSELGDLANLRLLSLRKNQLTGEIPPEVGNLAKLEWLLLNNNQLTGEIPMELGSPSNLVHVGLWGNELTGEIPAELGDLSNLELLSLSANQLTGEIPPELGSLANLKELWLSDNQLTGEIPAELGRLTNLTVLRLAGNQLTGCVPASLQDVANNDFAQLGLPFCHSYDVNGDGAIDIGELFSAIDDYFDGRIDISDLFTIIDLYFSGPTPTATAQPTGAPREDGTEERHGLIHSEAGGRGIIWPPVPATSLGWMQ